MRIDEVIRGLHQFIARVRVNGLVCDIGIESATLQQARALLAKSYGTLNVVSCVAVLDESETSSESLKPIKAKPSVMKTIKPMSAQQYNKKATSDLTKWIKKKARVATAQKKIQNDYAKLADINRSG